ncbi:MAG: hypothetical protein KF900_09140 [Bacteroidetes bacterium]|nr:hypothetical protein [Bacteroidota bacterium]
MKKGLLLLLLLIQIRGYSQEFTLNELINHSSSEFYDVLISNDFKFSKREGNTSYFGYRTSNLSEASCTVSWSFDNDIISIDIVFSNEEKLTLIKKQLNEAVKDKRNSNIRSEVRFDEYGVMYTYLIGEMFVTKKYHNISLIYDNKHSEYTIMIITFIMQ